MITNAEITAPAKVPEAMRPAPRSSSARSSALTVGFWILVLGLIGFNGWWYWRSTRPLPDLAALSTMIRGGRLDEAEGALREHLRRSPNNTEARIVLARVLAARKDLLGCAKELDRVPEWSPSKSEARLRAGQAYLEVNRAKDAETQWQAVIKPDLLHPVDPKIFHDAATALLNLYATEDRWDEAHVVMWRAYDEAAPSEHLALMTLRMKSEMERIAPGPAMVQIKKYVTADPTDYDSLLALAHTERMLLRRADALKHIKACLQTRPEDPRAWREYLTMLHEEGNLDELRDAVARVPRSAETEPEIWKFRGIVLEKKGDWAGAARAYRQAIERNPYEHEYHYRLGMAEDRLGRRPQAQEHKARANVLTKARSELSLVYSRYFELRAKPEPDMREIKRTLRRLGTLSGTLGWSRAAQAWARIADEV